MANLNILNSISIDAQGSVSIVKQGSATDGIGTPFALSVTGIVSQYKGTLATATVIKVWDEDEDAPTDFDYAIIWADQDFYVQIITGNTSAIFKVEAKCPFVIPGFDLLLGAATTTQITGGAEPSLEDIDSIMLGNYSGSTMNYSVALVD